MIAWPLISSFNGGELSPRMAGRGDTAIYAIGLETCENFVATVEGPIVKRPGFEYIRPAAATASWVSTFKFSITQEYLIEWSEGKLRFFTNGGRIETSPGVPYEVTVPYSAAEAPYVSVQQSFDRLYMAHPNYPPAALTRTSATTFSYAALDLKNGPFADQNTDATATLIASAVAGAITMAVANPIFVAGHVGELFRIEAKDFSDIPAWEAGIDGVLVGAMRRSDGKVYTAATAGRTGTVQPTHTEGTEWDGSSVGQDVNTKPATGVYGVKWTYRHDRFGIVRITTIGGGGTTAGGDVLRTLPDSVLSVATSRWSHGLFSTAAGWPNVVKAASGRLIFFKNFDVVGSVAGDYLNHATFTSSGLITADLAFRRTIATEDPVLWVAGDRKLIAGTASRELAIGAINQALALSGDNISAEPQSFYGSERVWPVQLGSSTFFVQRGGRKLREAQYDFGRDRYVASNSTVWARHITKSGLIQCCYQKEPEELLFAVRADGQMIAHPHQPEQDIKGFARIRHSDGAGQILSAEVIVGTDGKTDELWALVLRGGARSIERMAKWRDDGDAIADAFFVDAGLTFMAAGGQTSFTGATHLAGKAVMVLAGGGVVPGITVAGDGSFTLPATAVPATAYRVTVGLGYTATAVTLRQEIKINGNTSQGKRQRLVKIVLRLLDTVGIRVGALNGKLDDLIDRPADAPMDAAVPLFTGDSGKAVSGSWDRNGQCVFTSSLPLPATIVAAMPKLDIAGDDN